MNQVRQEGEAYRAAHQAAHPDGAGRGHPNHSRRMGDAQRERGPEQEAGRGSVWYGVRW